MGCFLSKKVVPQSEEREITEQEREVLDLKLQRDLLQQNQRKLKMNQEKEGQLAKKLLKEGKKTEAKLLLKKMRYQKQMLERINNQLEHLKKMVHQVQDDKFPSQRAWIKIQSAIVLSVGSKALKDMNKIMSIENVERIMEETREGIEYQREIEELLSGSLTQEDEGAVLQELEEMTKSVTENPSEVPA
ncbi:unnamed protein product [Pocillopora meandrina]|uniref:Charged multivesicular body protein 6 n=1 Tax=Pocillopora meandrina TaxID=46732 RepID=A0AAU9W0A9_9CNID|nr:unnamed protein product [Pocillopora meandrina]